MIPRASWTSSRIESISWKPTAAATGCAKPNVACVNKFHPAERRAKHTKEA